jgi:2-oxoglutarate ferredoxin oxidoreductase subunit alpha
MTPVVLLSDGFLGNGAEPWLVPSVDDLPPIPVRHGALSENGDRFQPYARDPATLARPWAIPGLPGLEHRIGGLEKWDGAGGISYDPANHERMVRLRAEKVERVAADVPPLAIDGADSGRLLVLGWGGTRGAISGALRSARSRGHAVSGGHLRWLNPFPQNLETILSRFERVLVPELNLGQLAFLLRGRFLRPIDSFSKVQGRPFTEAEILDRIEEVLR